MDLLPLAADLAEAIPTLLYVFLTTCGHAYEFLPRRLWRGDDRQLVGKWLSSKAWRVTRDHNNLHSGSESASGDSAGGVEALCTELSGSEEARIMDREEMHLSQDEEVGNFFQTDHQS